MTDKGPEDPFLAALAAAPVSDEPYTDEERAASEAGWQDYLRGDSMPLEEYLRALADDRETDDGGIP